MKTAKEILEQTYGLPARLYDESLIRAIQDYAQQEAIEFGKWCCDNYESNEDQKWNDCLDFTDDPKLYTTEDLYKIWKDENRDR